MERKTTRNLLTMPWLTYKCSSSAWSCSRTQIVLGPPRELEEEDEALGGFLLQLQRDEGVVVVGKLADGVLRWCSGMGGSSSLLLLLHSFSFLLSSFSFLYSGVCGNERERLERGIGCFVRRNG